MKSSTLAIIAVVLIVLAVGIGYLVYYPSRGNGTLTVGITDSPVVGVSHIYLSITNVFLQGEGNSSVSYSINSTSFDLLSIINVTKFVGSEAISAGNYTMIRFTVSSAVATILGSNVTLNVPSGEIKVPVHFQIKSGLTTKIILDVTADMTNISTSHNLRPVVTVKALIGPSQTSTSSTSSHTSSSSTSSQTSASST